MNILVFVINWKVILWILLWLVPSIHGAPFPAPRVDDWFSEGQKELDNALKRKFNTNMAKNVVVFVGDGMDITTITTSRIYGGQQKGNSGEENQLTFEKFQNVALSKTYNTDRQNPDSAGTATAILSGIKSRTGTVGVNQDVPRGDCSKVAQNSVDSILHYSHKEGKSTGIVTTARITHATPAATYAHTPDRDFEATIESEKADVIEPEKCVDIAQQLVRENSFINVLLGGGRRSFYPAGTPDLEDPDDLSERKDDLNLVQEWIDDKLEKDVTHAYVWNETEFDSVDSFHTEYLLGLFDYAHMQYELDKADDIGGNPSIVEMTQKAVEILSKNEKGFFLLVEGATIDSAHHDSLAKKAMEETVMMDEAVKKVKEMTNEDETLIVVTADHAHVFTMAGYSTRGNPIMGFVEKNPNHKEALDGVPYMVLGYANGAAYQSPRVNLTNVDLEDKDFVVPAGVPTESETHGGQDVGIFATGPMSHLFHGVHEQNYIAHVMMYASCVGPNKKHCENGAGKIKQNMFVLIGLTVVVNILNF